MGKTIGRVIIKRDLGGVKFLTILEVKGKINQFIVRKDMVSESVFFTSKSVKSGDIVRICYKIVGKDLLVVGLEILYNKISESELLIQDIYKMDQILLLSFIKETLTEFLRFYGYIPVDLPLLHFGKIKQDSFYIEGTYFKEKVRLTTSNALYLNILALNLFKVFSFTRTFRAEPSKTRKHLSEFTMLEVAALELNLEEIMDTLENLIKYLLSKIESSPFNYLIPNNVLVWKNQNFQRIEYKEVNKKYNLNGKGLGKYEKLVAEKGPIFIIGFPPRIASWMAKPKTKIETLSFNLLLPDVGEVAEGNQKISDVNLLKWKFKRAGVYKQLKWYLKLFPYNKVTLSGFGLGIERLLMWLLGKSNIREIVLFWRDWRFAEERYE